MKKIKILYVLSYISNNGGVQAVVNNYYQELKRYKNIQMDFLVLLPGDRKLEEELKAEGANIYHIKGAQEKNIFLFIKEIKKFFKNHFDYNIIHSHQTNLDFFYLREAKRKKIPIRIMHSHSTNASINKIRMLITKILSKKYSNYYFACSKEAGEYYFGKMFSRSKYSYIQNNAIDIEKYEFNTKIRQKYREKMNLEGKFVIGNIARMDENKNHKFLLNLFLKIQNKIPNAILLLIGDGPLKEELIESSKNTNIDEKIIFYGITDEIPALLQAMDCYILPSKYEGVPLTVIEATASGLNSYLSETIDSHLKDNIYENKISLNNVEQWLEKILNNKNNIRGDASEIIINSGFCLQTEARKLYNKYNAIIKGEKDG